MSALRETKVRVPLKARPNEKLETREVVEEVTIRYQKTLEYLGR